MRKFNTKNLHRMLVNSIWYLELKNIFATKEIQNEKKHLNFNSSNCND